VIKICREWFLITEDSLVFLSGGLYRWVTGSFRNELDSNGSQNSVFLNIHSLLSALLFLEYKIFNNTKLQSATKTFFFVIKDLIVMIMTIRVRTNYFWFTFWKLAAIRFVFLNSFSNFFPSQHKILPELMLNITLKVVIICNNYDLIIT